MAPGLADRLGMSKRAVLGLCGALMVAAWGVVALALATGEGGPNSVGIVIASLCLAVALTCWATELVVREWRGPVGVVTAAPVTGLATLSTLWLGVFVGVWLWPVTLMMLFGLPLGFGVLTTVLAEALARQRAQNGSIGAGLAVSFAVLFSLTGFDIAGGAVFAATAYVFWLVGVRWGVSVERRRRRRRRALRGPKHCRRRRWPTLMVVLAVARHVLAAKGLGRRPSSSRSWAHWQCRSPLRPRPVRTVHGCCWPWRSLPSAERRRRDPDGKGERWSSALTVTKSTCRPS